MFTAIIGAFAQHAFDQVVQRVGASPAVGMIMMTPPCTLSASQEFGVPATFQAQRRTADKSLRVRHMLSQLIPNCGADLPL